MDALLSGMTKWRIPRPKMTTSKNRPADPPQDYFDAADADSSADNSPNSSPESSANSSPSRSAPSDDF